MVHTHTHTHTHTCAEVAEELLKHGSEVKGKNNLGWTPVDEAISYGDKHTSEYNIISRSAHPNLCTLNEHV